MKILRTLSCLLLLVALLPACKDVVEPDLSKQYITLITPQDHDTTAVSAVTFWWKKIDEQNTYRYRIQIAKPNFTAPQALVLDSVTTSDKYNFTLTPGAYEWRVRSENGSSHTPYSTRVIVIDSSKDLSTQTVLLISPASNSTLYAFTTNFSWGTLSAANAYNLQIQTLTGATVLLASNITTNSYSYTFANYGSYQWRVWAENAGSISKPSAWYILNIGIKAPYSLTNPDSVTSPAPVVLNWNNYSPAVGDSLMIYKDNTSSTAIVSTFTSAKSYTFATNGSGVSGHYYYWKVRSVDGSNNTSNWVSGNQFKVK